MEPEALYLILCDDVQTDPRNYHRFHVFGLLTSIQSKAQPPFPVIRPLFRALLILTGGQGTGELMLRVIEDRTGKTIFAIRPRRVRFVGDPAATVGMLFHIQNCSFPAAGLYWVEVIYAGSVLARQRLFLKA